VTRPNVFMREMRRLLSGERMMLLALGNWEQAKFIEIETLSLKAQKMKSSSEQWPWWDVGCGQLASPEVRFGLHHLQNSRSK